jgi:hypothetical protein
MSREQRKTHQVRTQTQQVRVILFNKKPTFKTNK